MHERWFRDLASCLSDGCCRSLKEEHPEIVDLVAAASATADEDGEGGGAAGSALTGESSSLYIMGEPGACFAVETASSSAEAGQGGNGGRATKRKKLYAEHKTQAEIASGIKDGRYHQVLLGSSHPKSGHSST